MPQPATNGGGQTIRLDCQALSGQAFAGLSLSPRTERVGERKQKKLRQVHTLFSVHVTCGRTVYIHYLTLGTVRMYRQMCTHKPSMAPIQHAPPSPPPPFSPPLSPPDVLGWMKDEERLAQAAEALTVTTRVFQAARQHAIKERISPSAHVQPAPIAGAEAMGRSWVLLLISQTGPSASQPASQPAVSPARSRQAPQPGSQEQARPASQPLVFLASLLGCVASVCCVVPVS